MSTRRLLAALLAQIGTGTGAVIGVLSWEEANPGVRPILLCAVVGFALLGGFIGRAMGFYGPNQGAGWIVSILGAIILLVLYRFVARRNV